MKKFCFALDLKNDPDLIAEYESYHQEVWPEVLESIRDSGITDMEIYRYANRLFMIIKTTDDYSFEEKALRDAQNPHVRDWEKLMWKYQQALPGAGEGEKWMLMERIFKL